MSTSSSPDRRFIVALTAAVASATLAIGVTAGALLGWMGPRTTANEPDGSASAGAGSSQVVYVPISPVAPAAPEPRFAMVEADSLRADRDDRRDHDDDHREHDEDDRD